LKLGLKSGCAVWWQLLPGFEKWVRLSFHKISAGHKEGPVTRLRKMMLEELQRRNYAQNTARIYIKVVEKFAQYFGRSPERLGPNQIREYQVHLFRDCHLSATALLRTSASITAPCSVKTQGKYLMFCPRFKVANRDHEAGTALPSSSVS